MYFSLFILIKFFIFYVIFYLYNSFALSVMFYSFYMIFIKFILIYICLFVRFFIIDLFSSLDLRLNSPGLERTIAP